MDAAPLPGRFLVQGVGTSAGKDAGCSGHSKKGWRGGVVAREARTRVRATAHALTPL